MQNTDLRPLGAGELLDRAVTLFVRRFVPIVIVLAIAIVPIMILQAVLTPDSAHMFRDMGQIFSAGRSNNSTDMAAALSRYNSNVAGTFGFLLIDIVVRLLMWSAILNVVATAYTSGVPSGPRDAYIVGINCWPAQLLLGVVFSIIGGIVSIPLFFVYFLIIAGVFVLVSLVHSTIFAAIFGVVAGILLIASFALLGSFVYMTYELAAVSVVTESTNAIAAITSAVRRVSARDTWWRTAVAGLVVFAMTQGGSLPLLAVAAVLTGITHIEAFYYAILGTGTILLDGLVAVFVVVYATDVRIRREGLDLMELTRPVESLPVPG